MKVNSRRHNRRPAAREAGLHFNDIPNTIGSSTPLHTDIADVFQPAGFEVRAPANRRRRRPPMRSEHESDVVGDLKKPVSVKVGVARVDGDGERSDYFGPL